MVPLMSNEDSYLEQLLFNAASAEKAAKERHQSWEQLNVDRLRLERILERLKQCPKKAIYREAWRNRFQDLCVRLSEIKHEENQASDQLMNAHDYADPLTHAREQAIAKLKPLLKPADFNDPTSQRSGLLRAYEAAPDPLKSDIDTICRTALDGPMAVSDSAESASHSPDFRSVCWFGETYEFTPTQAACVKILWECWKQGSPMIGESTILDRARSSGDRLRDVFRSNRVCHPAWGKMIRPGDRRGTFRLAEPEKL
jgi:hypothetical protein